MQLYLIRHAESENNARPGYQRVEDPAITAVGRLQADHLASWTRTLKIDFLITSPFLRTLQTTKPVSDAGTLPVAVWHHVYERGGCYRGYGENAREGGPGLGRSAILGHLPCATVDETILETGWWGGRDRETETETIERARMVVERFSKTFGSNGQTVVAIVHAEFKRQLLVEMLSGIANPKAFGPLCNTGITKLTYDGQSWRLDWLNSVSHLPARLITGGE